MAFKVIRNNNILNRIDKLLKKDSEKITAFNAGFIKSLKEYYQDNDFLTEKQYNGLLKVESYINGDSGSFREEWKNDKELREKTKLVARFCLSNGIFYNMSRNILVDDSYVPSRASLNLMLNNKYVKKFLSVIKEPAKFGCGDIVMFRKIVKRRFGNKITASYGLVTQVDPSPITNACSGARKYLVLPFGEEKSIEIEERFLKEYTG